MAGRSWQAMESADVLGALEVEVGGLTAEQAAARLEREGPNALPEQGRRALWRIFLGQFISPLIYILFAAAGIAFVMGKRGDAGVILVVVVVNAIIGAFQEGRAERSMEALRRLSAVKVRVRRGKYEVVIDARELVRGDVMVLAAGDAVGADGRLIETRAMQAAEAALTGESLPVSKDPAALGEKTMLGDRRNMVYSGTHIAAGRGVAVVVATGSETEVGRIAELTTSAQEPQTPLEMRIGQFGRYVAVASVALVVVVLGVGTWRGMAFGEVFMVAVSQMVSLVPEGLPVAMTIALAVGMQRMAAQKALVRRLAAVETLGSTSVICTDKTGTLTRNEMTVTALWLADGRWIEVRGAGYAPVGELVESDKAQPGVDAHLKKLIEAGALCNDARLVTPGDGERRWQCVGDPTEGALLTLAVKGGVDPVVLREAWPRQGEIPFDPATKLMVTEHRGERGRRICVKGAPEEVIRLCGSALRGGGIERMEAASRREAEVAAREMAGRGLRVLAVADVEDEPLDASGDVEELAGRLVLLGLVGEMDPPREEVKEAVAQCMAARIRPVMVTGDHKLTGLSIARALGIAREGDVAVDGSELEQMPEQDLHAELDRISVFARVHPAQKLRIVEAFQAKGNVVAMTGDGVNDAPALARADVGVAMGISGTEVAKGAANIVISDDNFATIVKAVEEGRLVYQNLQKVILFLFATSIDEIIVLLMALFLGYPLPLAAVQILWINLVTEGTLTVNLIMEPLEGDEMRRPPVPKADRLLTGTMLWRMALLVPASVVATFGFFAWRTWAGAPFAVVQTETFTVLAVCQWFNVINCRSENRSAFTLDIFRNYWLVGGLVLANALQFLVVYVPGMNRMFHTVPIPFGEFFAIGAVASLVLWVEEARKWMARRNRPAC